jgi:hypothetical protein
MEYSNDAGATKDLATYDTSRSVWIRALAEVNTVGGTASGLTTTSGSQATFLWVEVTVDTRNAACSAGTFSEGSIEVFMESV